MMKGMTNKDFKRKDKEEIYVWTRIYKNKVRWQGTLLGEKLASICQNILLNWYC